MAVLNHSLPSLNSLKAFEVVARHLNYHGAAEELNVSAAAVKQLVSRLEDVIGTPLFKRQGRGIILTKTGQIGIEDISLAMKHMLSAVEKMRSQPLSKQLTITVEPSFASAWLIPQLASFRNLYPDINILIDSSPQLVDLERRNIDLAIRYGASIDEKYISHRLFDDQIIPACSPSVAAILPSSSLLRHRQLEDIVKVSLIHWDTTELQGAKSSRQWYVWDNWLSSFNVSSVSTHTGFHFNEYSQALQAAIAGQGMILVSKPIVSELFKSGLLVSPFVEEAVPLIGYDLVCTKESMQRSEVECFVHWILDAIQASDTND